MALCTGATRGWNAKPSSCTPSTEEGGGGSVPLGPQGAGTQSRRPAHQARRKEGEAVCTGATRGWERKAVVLHTKKGGRGGVVRGEQQPTTCSLLLLHGAHMIT